MLLSAAEAVLARLAQELVRVGGEEVMALVGLADEVEVVDAGRMSGGADRREARVRDRRRRQPAEAARVVPARARESSLGQGLGPRDVEPVADRRVDPERHLCVQAVVGLLIGIFFTEKAEA